jgi:hypothetical protein
MAEEWVLFKVGVETVAKRRKASIGSSQTWLRTKCASGEIRSGARVNGARTTISPDQWNGFREIDRDGWLVDPSAKMPGLRWYWPIEISRPDLAYTLKVEASQARPSTSARQQAKSAETQRQQQVKPAAPPRRSGGRPEKHVWEEARLYALKLLSERGDPTIERDQVKGWKTKTDLANAVLKHLKSNPDLSTVRGKVTDWLAEFQKSQSAQN